MTKSAVRLDLPDIFSFTSHRAYLRALADTWLADGKSWRQLAEHCGFSSPNFVQQLIAGKRNLTAAAAQKLGRRLLLTDCESDYLAGMLQLARSTDAAQIDAALKDMKRLVGRAKRQSIKDTSIFDRWIYGVVFELFKTSHCTCLADLAKVTTRLGLTPKELAQACEFLVNKGYLKQDGNRLVPADVEFVPQNDVRRINSQQNHLKFLSLAQHRINDDLHDREFQGLTFAVKTERMPALKECIREFIKTVNAEFAEDAGGDQVVRLQLALFKALR